MNSDVGISLGSTSSSLLERARLHDAQAWRQLTELYGPTIYGWCRRSGLAAPDAGDVFQDVCAALYTALPSFRKEQPEDSFRGWLWTITRRKLIDSIRKSKRAIAAKGGTDAKNLLAQIPEGPPEESGSDGENHELLKRALQIVRAEFEERTWQAFWRVVVGDEQTADVAEDLGITSNAVRQARSRVLRRLRQELGELADEVSM